MTKPFNSQDPLDATAEMARMLICDVAINVMDTPTYQLLSPVQKIEALLGGMVTGVLSVAFSCVDPAGHDDITEFVKSYVDQARQQVESIKFPEGTVQ